MAKLEKERGKCQASQGRWGHIGAAALPANVRTKQYWATPEEVPSEETLVGTEMQGERFLFDYSNVTRLH